VLSGREAGGINKVLTVENQALKYLPHFFLAVCNCGEIFNEVLWAVSLIALD